MRQPSRQQGFSLLEVLVAFAILALTLGVLMQIFAGGSRNAVLGQAYSRAAELAESTLALAGTEIPLQPGLLQGEQAGLRWDLEIVPEPVTDFVAPPRNLQLYRVSARVSWGADGSERSLVLDTLRIAQVVE